MTYEKYSYDELDMFRKNEKLDIFFYINEYMKEYLENRNLYRIDCDNETNFFWFSGNSYVIVNKNGGVFSYMKEMIYVII